ncbi:nuclear factor 7, brain-like [Podarcis lilfordi]|uniref:Nuclear factor 7, brain-like n=1 Tax=Podarcis lilfordi TaxID=74358 RepID=A0AA35JXI4_9SAUR|nr:nuclear factor 7, brain-like [Podarcis lilfordi]
MASNLAEDLLCPICLSALQEPHLLGCGHSFCPLCIKSCVPVGQGAGSCPECRRPFELQELASNVAQKVQRLELDGEPLPAAARDFCEEHEEPLELFCQQHRVPICVICRDLPRHRGHEFLPIENAVEDAQWELETFLRKLENFLKTTGDAESLQLQEMSEMENCTKDTLSHISREFEALHQILHEKEERFKNRVQKISKRNLKDMQNAVIHLKDEASSYTKMIARIKAALETTDHVAFLKGFKQLMYETAVGKDEGDSGEEEAGLEEECDSDECENSGTEDNSGFSGGIAMSAAVALEKFEASLHFDMCSDIIILSPPTPSLFPIPLNSTSGTTTVLMEEPSGVSSAMKQKLLHDPFQMEPCLLGQTRFPLILLYWPRELAYSFRWYLGMRTKIVLWCRGSKRIKFLTRGTTWATDFGQTHAGSFQNTVQLSRPLSISEKRQKVGSSNPCDGGSLYLYHRGENCLNRTSKSVQKGETITVKFANDSVPSEPYFDTCIWNNTDSRWYILCQFSDGVCKPYHKDFKENVSVTAGTFHIYNVSKDAGRIYKLLTISGKCVAWINVTVSGGVSWTYSHIVITVLAILLLLF